MLERVLNYFRPTIAHGDHLIELTAAGGDEGELRSHEEPVQRDQTEDGSHAARGHRERRSMGRLRSDKSKEHMGVIYIVVGT
jgi:hypothetical protein